MFVYLVNHYGPTRAWERTAASSGKFCLSTHCVMLLFMSALASLTTYILGTPLLALFESLALSYTGPRPILLKGADTVPCDARRGGAHSVRE